MPSYDGKKYKSVLLHDKEIEMWEIAFRIRYDYPFLKMSEKYPGSRIAMWCAWDRELLHVPLMHRDLMSEVEDYAGSIGMIVESSRSSGNGTALMLKCTCDMLNSVWNTISRNRCLNDDPAVFLDGWGYYKAISPDEDHTKRLFADLNAMGTVELVSKRKLSLELLPSSVWVSSFFAGMTGKQIQSLVKAFDYGYYSSPRQITTDSIARSIGVTRSTYEEHLRKAENRIMTAILPYLKMYLVGSQTESQVITPVQEALK